jgi:SAM-dependent methyltransferase
MHTVPAVGDIPYTGATHQQGTKWVRQTNPVNENHKKCGSDEWRAVVRDAILPWAVGDLDLGEDVLEVGPGYGATTDVLSERLSSVTAVEIDQELAAMLKRRFAGNAGVTIVVGDATALDFPDDRFSGAACFTMLHHVASQELQDRLLSEVLRVLRPGGVLVAGDSLGSPELAAAHEGDTYNPIDPDQLSDRLVSLGFRGVEVKSNDFGWAATASKA